MRVSNFNIFILDLNIKNRSINAMMFFFCLHLVIYSKIHSNAIQYLYALHTVTSKMNMYLISELKLILIFFRGDKVKSYNKDKTNSIKFNNKKILKKKTLLSTLA